MVLNRQMMQAVKEQGGLSGGWSVNEICSNCVAEEGG
jgi:hypothetical protein